MVKENKKTMRGNGRYSCEDPRNELEGTYSSEASGEEVEQEGRGGT
jgi:hypothetical protein